MATTTVAASSGGANAKGKLVGKDYITLAIFGVLLFLVFMMSAIVAVVALLLGMLWTGPVGIVAGGLLAELVAGAGSKRTTLRCLAAFAVWTLCFWVGQESMIFLAGDAYVQIVVDSGMSAEYGQGLVDFIHGPLALVALAATAVCPFVGGWIGSKLFKKHFAKISA